jgi:hypothetical protein
LLPAIPNDHVAGLQGKLKQSKQQALWAMIKAMIRPTICHENDSVERYYYHESWHDLGSPDGSGTFFKKQ